MSTRLDYSKFTLMDASLIELEAFKRCTQFAERLGSGSGDDAASAIHSMAVNEGKHGEQRRAPDRTVQRGTPKRQAPRHLRRGGSEVGAPRWNMSPIKAYQLALSSEKKAFAFYDQAL